METLKASVGPARRPGQPSPPDCITIEPNQRTVRHLPGAARSRAYVDRCPRRLLRGALRVLLARTSCRKLIHRWHGQGRCPKCDARLEIRRREVAV